MGAGKVNGNDPGMNSSGSIRVFLADDSRQIRQRVQALLVAADLAIVGEAATPATCIAAILDCHPHVVVLDHRLEGGTGLEVMRAVRVADPGIAFVVFSNNAASAYRKRYLDAGAVRFLDKSSEFDQLASVVAGVARGLVH